MFLNPYRFATGTIALTGNAAAGSVGTLAPSFSKALTGNAATGSPGTVTAGFIGVLDSYTSGLFTAVSIVRLLGSYAGKALRVRRSSDDAESDIGFVAGVLDTTALASFVGSDSAFVVTWYDQSGGGNDFTQATHASQPRIVNAGTYDATLVFNNGSTTQCLTCINTGGTTSAKSLFRKVLSRARNTFAFPWAYEDATGTFGDGQLQENDGSGATPYSAAYMSGGSLSAYSTTGWNNGADPASFGVLGHIFKRGLTPASSGMLLYTQGASQTQVNNSVIGSPAGGNFSAWNWRIGKRASDSNGAQINLNTFVVYDADMSSSANAINTALA